MTNKFRDALELYPRTGASVETLGRFQFDFTSTINQALTIAAALQDEVDTLKALSAAGDDCVKCLIIGNDRHQSGTINDDQDLVVSGISYMNNAFYGLAKEALFARLLFKKLAQLVKEGEQ